MPLKFDFHAHILPEVWPNLKEKFGYSGWIDMKHFGDGKAYMMKDDVLFRPVDAKVWSPSIRLSDMDSTDVSVQVLSTVPVMFSYWAKASDNQFLSQLLNNHLHSVVRCQPNRFVGLGTVPLQSPTLAVEEMKRCKTELNFNGIIIGSHVNEFGLDDKQFDMVWKTAEDLNMAIFLHPWDMQMPDRLKKYWLPYIVGMPSETSSAILSMIYSGVFERFPNLKVCLAHGGGMLPYIFGRAEHGFYVYPNDMQTDNVFPPSKYLGRIYADSLVHSENALNLAIKVFGEDSVLLGSDYPFLLGEHHPGVLIERSDMFSESLKKKLLYENTCKLLDLDYSLYT